MEMKNPNCQVCGEDKETVVCSVPAVPWSAAYCQECLDANAHPYHIIVSNTWALGGYDNSVDWWQAIVNDTLTHLEIPMEQFIEDVEADEF